MKIRFFNARIMTMTDGCALKEGELWVENDRILYIGDGSDLDDFYRRTGRTASCGIRRSTVRGTC